MMLKPNIIGYRPYGIVGNAISLLALIVELSGISVLVSCL